MFLFPILIFINFFEDYYGKIGSGHKANNVFCYNSYCYFPDGKAFTELTPNKKMSWRKMCSTNMLIYKRKWNITNYKSLNLFIIFNLEYKK